MENILSDSHPLLGNFLIELTGPLNHLPKETPHALPQDFILPNSAISLEKSVTRPWPFDLKLARSFRWTSVSHIILRPYAPKLNSADFFKKIGDLTLVVCPQAHEKKSLEISRPKQEIDDFFKKLVTSLADWPRFNKHISVDLTRWSENSVILLWTRWFQAQLFYCQPLLGNSMINS